MKIITFDLKITPPAGTEIAGYGPHDETWEIHDDLWLNGLILDDGERKAALLGFDLIGLEYPTVHAIRSRCAALLGTGEDAVVLSCTHTHGGPHTRRTWRIPDNRPYCDALIENTITAFREALAKPWTEVAVFFYSGRACVNTSRRYCGPDNRCKTLFKHRELEPLSDGVTDPEIGMLFFRDAATGLPVEVLVNYAAHPLASHCRGLGGHAVTADYPSVIRQLIHDNTRSHCTFVSGAAGDMFPKDSEIGWQNLDAIAKPIVREVLLGMSNAFADPRRYRLDDPKLKTMIAPYTAGFKPGYPREQLNPRFQDKEEFSLELQLLSIGDICFVGVPGELLTEIGLEIKWHSPFRRAYVLYNSTDYLNYICPVNALAAGGYEAREQEMEYLAGLKLLNTAVKAMFELHGPEIDIPETF